MSRPADAVDVHAHVFPESFLKLIAPHGPRERQTSRDRDTISHSPAALRYLIGLVGADRVMLGSDYCFDMETARPRDVVERQLKLPGADRARILSGTALRLLRL